MIIYTTGYARMRPDDLLKLAEGLDVTVVDIRGRPISRRPGFGQRQLMDLLGKRYTWWGDKLGGVYHLKNAELLWPGGATALVATAYLENMRLMLLCQCHAPGECHRHQVSKVITSLKPAVRGKPTPRVVHIFERESFDSAELERSIEADDEYTMTPWKQPADLRAAWEG